MNKKMCVVLAAWVLAGCATRDRAPDPLTVKAKFRRNLTAASAKWGEPDWSSGVPGSEPCDPKSKTFEVQAPYQDGTQTVYVAVNQRNGGNFCVHVLSKPWLRYTAQLSYIEMNESGKVLKVNPSNNPFGPLADDIVAALRDASR